MKTLVLSLCLLTSCTIAIEAQPFKVWERPIGPSAGLTNFAGELRVTARGADGSFIVGIGNLGSGNGRYWFDASASFLFRLPDFPENHYFCVLSVSADELLVFSVANKDATRNSYTELLYYTHKNGELTTQNFGQIGALAQYPDNPINVVDRDNFFTLVNHDGNAYLTKWRFETPKAVGAAALGMLKTEQGVTLNATSPVSKELDSSTDLELWKPVASFQGELRMKIDVQDKPKEFFRTR